MCVWTYREGEGVGISAQFLEKSDLQQSQQLRLGWVWWWVHLHPLLYRLHIHACTNTPTCTHYAQKTYRSSVRIIKNFVRITPIFYIRMCTISLRIQLQWKSTVYMFAALSRSLMYVHR